MISLLVPAQGEFILYQNNRRRIGLSYFYDNTF